MSFNSKTEEYYKRFIELQEKLRKSEEERLKLEMKFNEMLRVTREEEQMHYRKLRSQYKRFLEEDRRRQDRNERILRTLERIENRVAMLMAKTERFKLLRQQYQIFLDRVYKGNEMKKPEKETQYEKPVEGGGGGDDDVVKNYLENVSSHRLREMLNKKDEERLPYPDEGRSRTEFYHETELRPNYATSIAEDIMSSIRARYYNKTSDLKTRELNNNGDQKTESSKSRFNNELKYPSEFGKPYPENVTIDGEDTDSDEPLDYRNDAEDVLTKSENVVTSLSTLEIREVADKNLRFQENFTPKHQIYKSPNRDRDLWAQVRTKIRTSGELGRQINDNINFMYSNKESNETSVISERDFPIIAKEEKTENKDNIEAVSKSFEETNEKISNDGENMSQIVTSKEPIVEQDFALGNSDMNETEPIVEKFIEPVESPPSQFSEDLPKAQEDKLDDAQQNEQIYADYPDNHPQQLLQADTEPQQLTQHEIEPQTTVANYYSEQMTYDDPNQLLQQETSNSHLYKQQQQYDQSQYDENGQLIEQYDQQYDASGQPIQQYDEQGQPIQQYDEQGQFLQQYDENGQPLQQQYDQSQYDANGQLIQQYDEQGQPIQQYIQQYDEAGQPYPQYDEQGHFIPQYDEQGQLIQQYDEQGQLIQQYEEHGQLLQQYEGGNGQFQQYEGSGQYVAEQQSDQPQGYEEPQGIVEEKEESKKKVAQDVEKVEVEADAKKLPSNVMEMLDTDTESARQETKVSNDSDFDFSNG